MTALHQFVRRVATICRRPMLLAALVAIAVVGFPGHAWAHAHLRKSEPGANARLATAPRFLRLWFTEAPELSQTTVTLVDAAGTAVRVASPERDADGELAVRVAITGDIRPGRYTVRWRTAAADGHPSSGTFAFEVRPSPASPVLAAPDSATASARPSVASAPGAAVVAPVASTRDQASDADALTPAWIVARAVSFVALLAVLGAVTFRVAVVPRTSDFTVHERVDVASDTARRAVLLSAVLLLAAAAKLYLQNRMMSGSAAADLAHMQTMSMETHWGAAWRLQLGAGVVALVGFALAWRRVSGGWVVAGLASAALATSAALAGHAAAATQWRSVAIVDDTLHILSASAWLGSLLWLLVASLRVQKLPDAGRAARVASLVTAFSPVALASAATVVLTGLLSAWMRLGSVPALWTTSYGQVLLVKLLFLTGVIGTGFYNWRFVQPSLGTDIATARLRRSATSELAIGFIVIVVTAVLVAMPTPVDVVR
jgi:copper transport protein